MNRLIHSQKATPLFVVTTVLACFALQPQAGAVCQEGCGSGANTFLGDGALSNNTGLSNTGVGSGALLSNTSADDNTATGFDALGGNTTGNNNTANGAEALLGNFTGSDNTANGFEALSTNTTGNDNTANGSEALSNNITGSDNTAIGFQSLSSNTIGDDNTANGNAALGDNSTGSNNTANGNDALARNTTGSGNIAVGAFAGVRLTTGDNNIDIGNEGIAGESNTIRIGTQGTQVATYVAGISGVNIGKGLVVEVDAGGHLGTRGSSQRFKDEIKPMDKASEAILALKPVCFRYKEEIDPDGTPQFGLVAEQVEKVNPDLVVRDKEGKAYSVRYEAVNAMLLNEFLKEHRKVKELEVALNALNKHSKDQDAKIQQVNDQLKLSRPAPQIVKND